MAVSANKNVIDTFNRSEWKTVRFGDVVCNANATEKDPLSAGIERFVGLEHIEPGNLHVRKWGKVADGTTFTRTFKSGQTLFGKRRAYQRKVAYAEFEGVCSGDIYVFEPANDQLIPELLPFICQTDRFFEMAVGTSAGSLSPRTNWKHIKDYEFPLPPIDKQRRIAEILWAADATGEAYSCVRADLDRLVQVVVAAEVKYLIGRGCQKKRLDQIAKVERGKFSHRPRNLPEFYGGQYPFAQTGDVQRANGLIEEFEYTLTDEGLKYSKSFPAGSILITIAAVIGATAITKSETWATDSVVGIVPGPGVDVRYLELVLRMQRPFLENRAATQTAQKNINLQILRPLEVLAPELALQRDIVKKVDSIGAAASECHHHIGNGTKLSHCALNRLCGGANV